jgi:hypothetical protein
MKYNLKTELILEGQERNDMKSQETGSLTLKE